MERWIEMSIRRYGEQTQTRQTERREDTNRDRNGSRWTKKGDKKMETDRYQERD